MNQESEKWWINHPISSSRRSISNDVSATLVRSQLKKLDKFCAIQKHFHDYFNLELYTTPAFSPLNLWKNDDYFLYLINAGDEQQELADYLRDCGIYVGFKYYPVHQSKLYWKYHIDLPNTDLIANTHLNIPIHKKLTIEEAKYIVSSIKSYYTNS
jgi:dTDP-4-amino-4,6-dideoxygalactose transaminase